MSKSGPKQVTLKPVEKKSLLFSKLRPYCGIYKRGTLKAQDQGIISQNKVAHLTYVARLMNINYRNPTLGPSVRMQLTLPKVGKWSPPGLPKTQKTI
jgi:hypothetical protein